MACGGSEAGEAEAVSGDQYERRNQLFRTQRGRIMCEFCPADGSGCSVCGTCDHNAPKRKYAMRAFGTCMGVLLIIVAVATLCAIVNQLTTR